MLRTETKIDPEWWALTIVTHQRGKLLTKAGAFLSLSKRPAFLPHSPNRFELHTRKGRTTFFFSHKSCRSLHFNLLDFLTNKSCWSLHTKKSYTSPIVSELPQKKQPLSKKVIKAYRTQIESRLQMNSTWVTIRKARNKTLFYTLEPLAPTRTSNLEPRTLISSPHIALIIAGRSL